MTRRERARGEKSTEKKRCAGLPYNGGFEFTQPMKRDSQEERGKNQKKIGVSSRKNGWGKGGKGDAYATDVDCVSRRRDTQHNFGEEKDIAEIQT